MSNHLTFCNRLKRVSRMRTTRDWKSPKCTLALILVTLTTPAGIAPTRLLPHVTTSASWTLIEASCWQRQRIRETRSSLSRARTIPHPRDSVKTSQPRSVKIRSNWPSWERNSQRKLSTTCPDLLRRRLTPLFSSFCTSICTVRACQWTPSWLWSQIARRPWWLRSSVSAITMESSAPTASQRKMHGRAAWTLTKILKAASYRKLTSRNGSFLRTDRLV